PAAAAVAPAPAPVDTAPRDVVPFGEGMTRPVMLQPGKPIVYSREATAARVEGTMIVRCVITVAGTVERCNIIKPRQFMNEAVGEVRAGDLRGQAGLGRLQLLGAAGAAEVTGRVPAALTAMSLVVATVQHRW